MDGHDDSGAKEDAGKLTGLKENQVLELYNNGGTILRYRTIKNMLTNRIFNRDNLDLYFMKTLCSYLIPFHALNLMLCMILPLIFLEVEEGGMSSNGWYLYLGFRFFGVGYEYCFFSS